MTASAQRELITLAVPTTIHVIREVIEGEISLNFAELQNTQIEELHVKLRGSVATRITRSQGQSTRTRRQVVELVRQNLSVWTRGSAYPPAGTDILRLPFRFTLSTSQELPSCYYEGRRRRGCVGYSIEAVGVRTGLHFNKRVYLPMSVLPSNLKGASLSQELRSGLVTAWRNVEFKKAIRRGIWGDFSNVQVTLTMPDIPVVPIFTPIPIVINVTTITKPMKQEDTPTDQPIFPAPPDHPRNVEFNLSRQVMIRTHSWTEYGNNTVAVLGGFGPGAPANRPNWYDEVQVETAENVWLPDLGDEKKNRGSWKQQITFRSNFTLTCPPTFSSNTMSILYNLEVKVSFPGIGNDLKGHLPIIIVSSMLPPGAGAWDGPPPELELPPAYFSASDWSHDEKDGD